VAKTNKAKRQQLLCHRYRLLPPPGVASVSTTPGSSTPHRRNRRISGIANPDRLPEWAKERLGISTSGGGNASGSTGTNTPESRTLGKNADSDDVFGAPPGPSVSGMGKDVVRDEERTGQDGEMTELGMVRRQDVARGAGLSMNPPV